MSRPVRIAGALVVLLLVLVAGLYGYRRLMIFEGRTPEGFALLTPLKDAGSFEPKTLPQTPVLTNQSETDLAVSFGYQVGTIPYSYAILLHFPDKSNEGHATVTARHGAREASVEASVTRRWDAPRQANAVAVQDQFDIEPAVPALCIKAVIGPKTEGYDLRDGSICVAQRDAGGNCHPETIACGLIR